MKILAVKLSDIGDVLTATPALRALRNSLPEAHIAALVAPGNASVLENSPLVDRVLVFDKARFDTVRGALEPKSLALGLGFYRRLREEQFDAILVLHHLSTWWGTLKYALLCLATGAPLRAGLDNNRGWFLTHRARDEGFGAYHEVEYWLQVAALLGAEPKPYPMEIPLSLEDEAFATTLIGTDSDPLIMLHPGGGTYSLARRWSPFNFVVVGQELQRDYGAKIIVVGGHGEEALVEQVVMGIGDKALSLAGRTSLSQLAALLKRCHLFIGNDSGVMHLAAAAGAPIVAIFGPSNPKAWGPWRGEPSPEWAKITRVVRLDLPCSPCLYVGHWQGNRLGPGGLACLQDLEPEIVLAAAREVLAHGAVSLHIGHQG